MKVSVEVVFKTVLKVLSATAIGIMLGSLLAIGCMPETQQKKNFTDGTILYKRQFVLDGHWYIELGREGTNMLYDNYTGYVHDPNCPKCEEKLRKLVQDELEKNRVPRH